VVLSKKGQHNLNFMLLKALLKLSKTSPFLLYNSWAFGRVRPWTPLSGQDPHTPPLMKPPTQLVPMLLHYSGYVPAYHTLVACNCLTDKCITFLSSCHYFTYCKNITFVWLCHITVSIIMLLLKYDIVQMKYD
jgi:hypothetical protein